MTRSSIACIAACTISLGLAGCAASAKKPMPVTLSFPDFPENTAVMDLGQSLTIEIAAQNDDGAGVTWKCEGEGCAPLKTTPTSLIFKAAGITGKAVITATSKKQPSVSRTITVGVGLNESPDMLCK